MYNKMNKTTSPKTFSMCVCVICIQFKANCIVSYDGMFFRIVKLFNVPDVLYYKVGPTCGFRT